MDEYRTRAGGIVDALARAVIPSDTPPVPRDNPPNSGGSGPNMPPVSVGPTSSEGDGNTHVVYDANLPPPPSVQAWSGWPVDWYTPYWGGWGWWRTRTSTVMTCCDVVGRTCAQFQPTAAKNGTPINPQPQWTVNPEPNLYGNFDEWQKGAVNSLMLRGEMILAATARNAEGYPVRFVTLNPDVVQVEMSGGGLRFGLGERELAREDVLFVKYQTTPGNVRGIPPLDWIARNLIGAEALEKYGSDLATNGGIPWGVLTHPGNLVEGQATELRSQWNEAQQQRGSAPAILSGGMTLQPLSLSPDSMALLQLREFDEQRIAAAFGVPPMYVGLPQPSGLNYTSSEMIADFFYRATLKPMVKNIGDGLTQWTVPRGTDVFFDASEYLRPPIHQFIPALVQLASITDHVTGAPAITVDEIRQLLNMPAQGQPVTNTVGVSG